MKFKSLRLSLLTILGSFVLSAPAHAAARITRGPCLQSLLGSSVVVMWKTDAPSVGRVRWSGADGAGGDAGSADPLTDHRVSITGLVPGGAYRYALLDGDAALTAEFTFRTSPPPGEGTVKVAVAGDTGTGDSNQKAVAQVIEGMRPDLFVHNGDIDYINDQDKALFIPYQAILPQTCIYPCKGNDHDPLRDWFMLFTLPLDGPRPENQVYYSFDWGAAHFTAIDTEDPLDAGSPQRVWIEADLAAARSRQVPWLIVYFHRPPYTVGRYGTGLLLDRTLAVRKLVTPLVDQFAVDLVLNGHDHNYQRTYPVRADAVVSAGQDPHFVSPGGAIYVVSGGGGRLLYKESPEADHSRTRIFVETFHAVELVISAERIEAQAISSQGKVIDSFSLEKGFTRGDVDANGTVELPDVVGTLEYLFREGVGPRCLDRADANDDSRVDISDPIYLLFYLFNGGTAPLAPFPGPGPDPTPDDLSCS